MSDTEYPGSPSCSIGDGVLGSLHSGPCCRNAHWKVSLPTAITPAPHIAQECRVAGGGRGPGTALGPQSSLAVSVLCVLPGPWGQRVSLRTVGSVSFWTYTDDLSFSQHSAWATQFMEKQISGWWLILLMSELGLSASLPNSTAGHSQLSAQEQYTVFTLLFYLTVS